MNEDYENEQENEEEDQEENEGYDNYSSNYDAPPTSNNPFLNIKNKTRKAASDFGKKAFNAFIGALKGVFTFLVSNPIILIIIGIFVGLAIIWLVISDKISKDVTSSVKSYISSSDTIDETAKGLFETRDSLILLKLSEINEMYDKFIRDKTVSGNVKTAMKTKVGKNDVEKKKASIYDSSSFTLEGYDKTFKPGSDGVRDDERVKIITGGTAPISTYKVNGAYTWENGSIGGVKVEIVDLTIPIWTGSGNNKVSSTAVVQVNAIIKDMVASIFKDIYEDPSKPVIEQVGGFRKTGQYPNHPFGTGIDINPNSNPQIKEGANVGGPYNPGSDPLAMDSNHPIVKIFTQKYGWDWGGSWTSYKDYMHFSFLGG